ncbi:Histidine kinase-, DNA gyrase B-, and HSP90-like ATPase [Paenibacillus sp. UNC496MF]|uniref:sensor histidine kinase n=1 Tax=Paenibacillus sp. UNC496MF TaxID=1502753 RepID=UPI0008E9D750|nr:histidine kinase [Paenibacillus sp. UNC496MF]SFJ93039.1 Histidine kinase-, DNA gyrase B-, and HSP90-like ATPase [Paenibacillus sp. UNC496MF]
MPVVKRAADRFARLFHRLQYRQKLLVAILLLTLSPLLLLSIVYMSAYARSKLDAILQQDGQRFAAEVENLDNNYYSGIKKSVYITNNQQIIQMLKEDYGDDLLDYMNNLDSFRYVLDALRSDELQSDITIYGFNPSIYRTDGIRKIDDLDAATRSRVLANSDDYPVRSFLVSPDNGRPEVHIYSKIMDFNETLAITEVVFPLNQPIAKLQALLPSGSFMLYRAKDGTSFAVGRNGVSPDDMPQTGQSVPQDVSSYYQVTLHLKSAQDDLLLYVTKTSIWLRLGGLLAIPLVMLVGLLLTILLSIRFVTLLLTRRLTALTSSIRSETDTLESFGSGIAEPGSDELGLLEVTFRGLVMQIRDHYRQSAENELERRLLEAELLQGNINPHVLYNTLSAIKWIYPEDRLQTLVDDMVDFYRSFLNRGEIAAPLTQEFEMIRKYLDIHKFAYDSDFIYELELAEEAGKAYILRNMLQPIVENALVHGVNSLASGGRVELSARAENEHLVIEVTDNGQGIQAWQQAANRPAATERTGEQRKKTGDRSGFARSGSGYALANIRRRIKLYYGEDYDIRFEAAPGGGTRVILRVPCRNAV